MAALTARCDGDHRTRCSLGATTSEIHPGRLGELRASVLAHSVPNRRELAPAGRHKAQQSVIAGSGRRDKAAHPLLDIVSRNVP